MQIANILHQLDCLLKSEVDCVQFYTAEIKPSNRFRNTVGKILLPMMLTSETGCNCNDCLQEMLTRLFTFNLWRREGTVFEKMDLGRSKIIKTKDYSMHCLFSLSKLNSQCSMLQKSSKCDVKAVHCGNFQFYCHSNFTWNQILVNYHGPKNEILAILEVLKFDFGKFVQCFKAQIY